MKRISSIHTPTGYRFVIGDRVIADAEWSDGKLFVIDTDAITEHVNGMDALIHLNRKHLPGYYDAPVRHPIPEPSTRMDRFKSHPALAGVTKEVMFAK